MKGNLQEHMDTLAHDVPTLAFCSKVDEGIIRRALAGQPIPESDARSIRRYVGSRFGHPHSNATEYQIDGLTTV